MNLLILADAELLTAQDARSVWLSASAVRGELSTLA